MYIKYKVLTFFLIIIILWIVNAVINDTVILLFIFPVLPRILGIIYLGLALSILGP